MARVVSIDDEKQMERLSETLFRAVQSSHLSFLLGAGASCPGVAPAGNTEAEIQQLVTDGETDAAEKRTVEFLQSFAVPMKELLSETPSGEVEKTLNQYVRFIQTVDGMLGERKNTLLPKQASIFTTNYDLFPERASEEIPSIILNDGFNRVPSLRSPHRFMSEKLFDSTHHVGNLYDYTAELPSINLIKLHGSMTWARQKDDVIYSVMDFDALAGVDASKKEAVAAILQTLPIVLPTQRKFHQTILERTYYDLLRIFANVLEREGSLLIAFGFSFRDEHIFEVVKRALRNPTLKLIVCCFDPSEVEGLQEKFLSYNNVSLLKPAAKGDLDFKWLSDLLARIAPVRPTLA